MASRPRAGQGIRTRLTGVASLALVHERFTDFAGSELVVEQFSRIWPDAPILAPIVNPDILPPGMSVRPGRLNRLYRNGGYAYLLPLLPRAMRTLPIPRVDAVLASHHAFANQVVWATDSPVISYVHSPARWMWEANMREGEIGGRVGEAALAAFSATQRRRDYRAAQRVRSFIANSTAVAERIRKWWNRESTVIFPPVDTTFYHPDPGVPREGFALVAGRMVPYKHPEIAIAAAERLGMPIVAAGDGRAMHACQQVAGRHTTFVGRVSNEQLRDLYRRCACLVMPGEEDFGIVPVEAQACGAPVVALRAGGALDTVIDGVTGLLVEPGRDLKSGFAEAMAHVEQMSWDRQVIVEHASTFARPVFRARIEEHVERILAAH